MATMPEKNSRDELPPALHATGNGEGKWIFVSSRDKGKASKVDSAALRRATLSDEVTSPESDAKAQNPMELKEVALHRDRRRVNVSRQLTGERLAPLAALLANGGPLDRGVARGILGAKEYSFRLATSVVSAISANVTAGASPFSPLGLGEWTGVIDALFDEYRVDKVKVTYVPVLFSGSTAVFDNGSFAVASDYDATTTATSLNQVWNYADARVIPAMLQSGSGYFISNSGLHSHVSHMPKSVAAAGSVATVEWLDTDSAWPGGQIYFAATTGTNGVTTIYRYIEWFVRCRMRR